LLVRGVGEFGLREEPGVGNGTWVNGSRLQPEQEVAVKPGDTLRFGAVEVRLKGL
jgi:pSer/pThr/pTyr-binding forkhead associated (FHA) protein